MKRVIVAIDGPAGAGKSSVAKAVATRLSFALVDTGATYRCVALAALERGVSLADGEAVARIVPGLAISFRFEGGENRVTLDGRDVSGDIRRPEISQAASTVGKHPPVRAGLLDLQRRLARDAPAGAVLEGRDIGTVVFPDADVKLFVTASPEVRARRRQRELAAKGVSVTFEQVLAEQEQRDREDSSRAVAPLREAADATRLDTSALGLEEVIEQVIAAVRAAQKAG